MTKTWLAAIPVALIASLPPAAPAQGPRPAVRARGEVWAAGHASEQPGPHLTAAAPPSSPPATINGPVPLNPLPPAVAYYLPQNNPPPPVAAIGAPLAEDHAPTGGCAGCAREKLDLRKLRDWACYEGIRGGCPKRGSCGCNCSTPLYLYFIKECHEGRKYELPPPCDDCGKGVLGRLFDGARMLVRSVGHSAGHAVGQSSGHGAGQCAGHGHPAAPVNTADGCGSSGWLGATGHRHFGQPTGQQPCAGCR